MFGYYRNIASRLYSDQEEGTQQVFHTLFSDTDFLGYYLKIATLRYGY